MIRKRAQVRSALLRAWLDPRDPARDLYGNASWPGVDGRDVWGWITGVVEQPPRLLVLSAGAILNGSLKLAGWDHGVFGVGHGSANGGRVMATGRDSCAT